MPSSAIIGSVPGQDLSGITDWPSDVSATEVGYLDGVTSSIQDQLDAIVSNPLDVMGGRPVYTSDTLITLLHYTSNQSRLHNGTNWVTVRKASTPTLANDAHDMGGTDLTYGYNYDLFEVYSSPTASTLAAAIWATNTARYAAWAGSTLYKVGKRVSNSGSYYACATEHTSGTFADDLAAGKWVLVDGTGYLTGLGICDGVPVYANSGDLRKYRYIGIIRLYNDSGAKFKFSATQFSIASFYNPRLRSLYKSTDASGTTFNSSSWAVWSNWTSPGVEFVTCGVHEVQANLLDALVSAVADQSVYARCAIDGGTYQGGIFGRAAGDEFKLYLASPVSSMLLPAGYHYGDAQRAQGGATANSSAQYSIGIQVVLWC